MPDRSPQKPAGKKPGKSLKEKTGSEEGETGEPRARRPIDLGLGR